MENLRYEIRINRIQLKALEDTCTFAFNLRNGIMLSTVVKWSIAAYRRHYKEHYHTEPDDTDMAHTTEFLYRLCSELKRMGFNCADIFENGKEIVSPIMTCRYDELNLMAKDFHRAMRLRVGDTRKVGDIISIRRINSATKQPTYLVSVNNSQLKLLSSSCEQYSRFITGQFDYTLQDAVEEAWEQRYVATHPLREDGRKDFGIGTPEWYDVRNRTEEIINDIRWTCWPCSPNSSYGIHYDEYSDMLWDMYEVFRHQLWLDRPEDKKVNYTVDAYPACRWSDQSLPIIYKEVEVK